MPVPRHATSIPFRQLPGPAGEDGVTELRIHGVGGTSPADLLGDLAPEQVSGDRIAGCYRSSDRAPAAGQPGRHVECYSWGGLTSRSRTRVLWLLLLPFMLANLAGWMCSPRTRRSRWRFALHRAAAGLAAMALTVNVALVSVMISAGILAYQSVRAGKAAGQWWLAPLRWPLISGYPARQVLIGGLVPVLFVLALDSLARLTRQRYERVQPPYLEGRQPKPRSAAAAALPLGLADQAFWDGERSVARLARLHVAAASGFLAVALGVTTRALASPGPGTPPLAALWWAGVAAGGAAVAGSALLLAADAVRHHAAVMRTGSVTVLLLAAAGFGCAAAWAWEQPGQPAVHETAAQLPGLAGLVRWTAAAIAVPVILLALSVALGAGRGKAGRAGPRWLAGGPLVTVALAISITNLVLFGVLIWIAHLVGPVTGDTGQAAGHICLPSLITLGVPLAALAAMAAVLAFALVEVARWWRHTSLPPADARRYRHEAARVASSQPADLRPWYCSALAPPPRPGDPRRARRAAAGWQRHVARRRWLAGQPRRAGWLLWGVIAAQAAAVVCTWRFHKVPPLYLRNAGTAIAALLLTPFIGYLYAAWGDPARRRQIGVLWDVGTFWPRSYHPLAPPCYAERAVPDLQRRLWWLHDHGGRTLLVGHSQGSMLALAAVAQPGCRAAGDHPALVTFGAPVCKLYGWVFPGYLSPEQVSELTRSNAGQLAGWRNIYYPTDPIGGPVNAAGAGPDLRLLDPADCWYVYGQPLPAPLGHSGYWADPRVWKVIDGLAAGLGGAPGTGERGGRPPPRARRRWWRR